MSARRRINLIPVEKKRASPRLVGVGASLVVPVSFAVLFVALLGLAGSVWWGRRNAASRLAAIQAQAAQVDEQIAGLTRTAGAQRTVDSQRKLISDVLARKSAWAAPLKELSLRVPSEVWLDDLKAEIRSGARHMELVGLAESPGAVTDFFHALEESYSFKRVMMQSSERDDGISPAMYRFKFEAPLDEAVVAEAKPQQQGKAKGKK
jgi:Tfp pilus assembly protein PilN